MVAWEGEEDLPGAQTSAGSAPPPPCSQGDKPERGGTLAQRGEGDASRAALTEAPPGLGSQPCRRRAGPFPAHSPLRRTHIRVTTCSPHAWEPRRRLPREELWGALLSPQARAWRF